LVPERNFEEEKHRHQQEKYFLLEMEHHHYKILQHYQTVQNLVELKELKMVMINHYQKHFHQVDS